MKFILGLFTICMMFVSCKTERKELSEDVKIFKSAHKVVGYRFTDPKDRDPGLSLLRKNGDIDLESLDKLKAKETTLSEYQTHILLQSVYETTEKFTLSACYEPHHIFLFYDETGKIFNAIEVCFKCKMVSVSPDFKGTHWSAADFKELAKLCDDIGIGMTQGTADDYISKLEGNH